MATAGRRKAGQSAFTDYLRAGIPHRGLRLIAQAAARRGWSVRTLAKEAKRDVASVSRSFDAKNIPTRSTIDALAKAVGIDLIPLHAELDDLTDQQLFATFNEVISYARIRTFTVGNQDALKRIIFAFRDASTVKKNTAIRSWALKKSLRGDEGLRPFLEVLGLASLLNEDGENLDLWMLVRAFSQFGFDDTEVRRLIAPAIRELRERNYPGLDAMIASARNTPISPINLEEPA
jgi:hypothetical protein